MVNYRKQMGALITGQMLSMLLSFVLPLILVRILTKNDYGLYAQFNVILAFCTTFFSFGFSSELYFLYPSATRQEKRIQVFQSLLMLFGAGFVAVFLLYVPIIKQYLVSDEIFDKNYIYLVLSVWFSVPEILITALYVLNHDNKTSVLFLPIMAILRVALVLILYLVCPTIEIIFLAIVISVIIRFLFLIYYVFKLVRCNIRGRLINWQLLKKQLNYSVPLGIANSTRVFVQQMDKLIILSFVSPAMYAIYSIAFYGVPGLTQVYLSISQVYIPRMAVAFKSNDLDDLVALYHSMVSKTLSYTIPIVFIIILFANSVVTFVFSSKYVDSIPYFRLYLLTFIISSIGCGNVLRATGETRKSLLAYIYTAIVLLPFTYLAIKYYSLNGAITAAILGSIFPKLLLSIYDARAIQISILKLYPWVIISKILLISLGTLFPFVLIRMYIGNQGIGSSLIWITFYLFIVSCIQMYYNVFVISYADLRIYIHKLFNKNEKYNC